MASLIRRKDPGQAWETEVDTGGGGSQPVRYDFVVDATTFPAGNEIVGTGVMLEVGDSIIDICGTCSADFDPNNDFFFGANTVGGGDKLSSNPLNMNDAAGHDGPYSGLRSSGHFFSLSGADALALEGRLPVTVLTAHELKINSTDPITAGSCTISVYVLPAACAVVLPTPVPA